MEISEKLNIVSSFLGGFHKVGHEYLYHCPFCNHHKKKLSLNFEKGKYKCWVCDVHGNIRKLVKKKATLEVFQRWKQYDNEIDLSTNMDDLFSDKTENVEEILSLPENFITLTSNINHLTHIKYINYLKKRGLSKQDILFWKIGFCTDGEYKDRVVVPSFNKDGNLNYFIGRNITGDKFAKYKQPQASKDIIFNELFIDFDQDIVLVEGIFDAIKAGQNSIPLLGSTLREESVLFQKIVGYDSTVYLALDPDANKKENEILKKLINYGVETYKIYVDPYKDVGDMPHEEFLKRKEQASLITYDTLLQKELEFI